MLNEKALLSFLILWSRYQFLSYFNYKYAIAVYKFGGLCCFRYNRWWSPWNGIRNSFSLCWCFWVGFPVCFDLQIFCYTVNGFPLLSHSFFFHCFFFKYFSLCSLSLTFTYKSGVSLYLQKRRRKINVPSWWRSLDEVEMRILWRSLNMHQDWLVYWKQCVSRWRYLRPDLFHMLHFINISYISIFSAEFSSCH